MPAAKSQLGNVTAARERHTHTSKASLGIWIDGFEAFLGDWKLHNFSAIQCQNMSLLLNFLKTWWVRELFSQNWWVRSNPCWQDPCTQHRGNWNSHLEDSVFKARSFQENVYTKIQFLHSRLSILDWILLLTLCTVFFLTFKVVQVFTFWLFQIQLAISGESYLQIKVANITTKANYWLHNWINTFCIFKVFDARVFSGQIWFLASGTSKKDSEHSHGTLFRRVILCLFCTCTILK